MRRKLLMVGRMRYALPLSPSLAQKFDALVGRARRARPRELGRRERGRPAVRARAPCVAARARRPRFLRAAAVPRRPGAARLRARRGSRAGRPGDRARASRPRLLARVPTRVDRRHPRRSRRRDAAVRLSAPQGARAGGRRARAARAAPRRRRADDLGRTPPASCARAGVEPTADVRGVHGPRAVRRSAARADARATAWRSSSACSSATRRSTCSPRRGGCGAARSGGELDIVGRGTLGEVAERLVADLPEPDALARGVVDRRRSPVRSTRRVCSCSLPLRGSRPGRRRGVLPRARSRRSRVGGIPDSLSTGRRPARAARRRGRPRRRARARARRPRTGRAAGRERRGRVEPWLAHRRSTRER